MMRRDFLHSIVCRHGSWEGILSVHIGVQSLCYQWGMKHAPAEWNVMLCAITGHDSGCAGAVVDADGSLLIVDQAQASDPMSNVEEEPLGRAESPSTIFVFLSPQCFIHSGCYFLRFNSYDLPVWMGEGIIN